MAYEEAGEGQRLMAFLYARSRYREALERGASEATAALEFSEHFIGKDEGDTGGYAKVEVAALLGNLRIEQWRGK